MTVPLFVTGAVIGANLPGLLAFTIADDRLRVWPTREGRWRSLRFGAWPYRPIASPYNWRHAVALLKQDAMRAGPAVPDWRHEGRSLNVDLPYRHCHEPQTNLVCWRTR